LKIWEFEIEKVFDKNAQKNMNATIVIASIAKQSEDIRWQLIGVYALGITLRKAQERPRGNAQIVTLRSQ
jgi:hypothetical protein